MLENFRANVLKLLGQGFSCFDYLLLSKLRIIFSLVSRCFTLGRWSRAKHMMREMLARNNLEQKKEVPLEDWHGKR